jgi:hypothetical protein
MLNTWPAEALAEADQLPGGLLQYAALARI